LRIGSGAGEGQSHAFSMALPQGGWREPKAAKTMNAPAKSRRTLPLLKDRAIELARKLGTARTRDFAEIGISRHYLCKLCSKGVLTRAGTDGTRCRRRRHDLLLSSSAAFRTTLPYLPETPSLLRCLQRSARWQDPTAASCHYRPAAWKHLMLCAGTRR